MVAFWIAERKQKNLLIEKRKKFKKALTEKKKERILMKLSRTGQQNKQKKFRTQHKRISKNSLTIKRNDDIIEKLLQSETIARRRS